MTQVVMRRAVAASLEVLAARVSFPQAPETRTTAGEARTHPVTSQEEETA